MTTTIATDHHDRPSLVERLARYAADLGCIFRAAREAQYLMQLSDAQLERHGMRRDEIVSRTFAAYLEDA